VLGVAVCALAAVAGASGLTQNALFTASSNLKYAVTVLVPIVGAILLASARPLRSAVVITIVCIPFADAAAHFAGTHVTLLTAALALATAVSILTGPRPQPLSGFAAACLAAIALLVGPLLIGHDSGGAVVLSAMVLVGWLTARVAREGEDGVTAIYWSVVVAALIQAVIAIYEFKTNHHINLYGSAGSGGLESHYFGTAAGHAGELHSTERPSGTLYDPISLGNILALSCPMIIVLAARTRDVLLLLALVAAAVVIALALALTFSRFSWIGGAAGTVIAALLLPTAGMRSRALSVGVAAIVLAVVLALATAGPRLTSRFESIANPTHAANHVSAKGDRERVEAWNVDLKTFLEHPLAGVGLGRIRFSLARYLPSVREGSNGQNTYLQIAAEAGLLGVAALALLIGALATSLSRGLRTSRSLAAAALGANVSIALVWLTDVTIRYSPVAAFFAIVFGVTSALPHIQARRPVGDPRLDIR